LRNRGTAPPTCPHCGGALAIVAAKKSKRAKRSRDRAPRVRNMFEFDVQAFDQGAAPALPTSSVTLEPGESRTVEQRRPETPLDVRTYVGKGFAIGAALFLCSTALPLIDGVPWYTPAIVLPVGTGLGILLSITRPRDWLVGLVENVLQRDIDGDGEVGKEPTPYRVDGILRDAHGNQKRLGFNLEHGTAQDWHEFCKAVVAGRNFSGREAGGHGDLGKDWAEIYRAFTAQHWASQVGERGTPKLSPTGMAWIRHYARTPPPA